jgi:hypothetical protein
MTGGHVEDEVEEAEQAHELAEGRMENSAQVELLAAIREMSRAEARLNAGDTTQGLQFERAALNALQRAFDRRRYLLRTLPERTRIDPSRRLTGELATARSSTQSPSSMGDPLFDEARAVLQELGRWHARLQSAVAECGSVSASDLVSIAARLLALDPNDKGLQAAALQLTAASEVAARLAAVQQAQRAVAERLRARMPASTTLSISRDAVTGRLVQELQQKGRP